MNVLARVDPYKADVFTDDFIDQNRGISPVGPVFIGFQCLDFFVKC